MVVKANPGDVRGKGYYLWADQKWAGAPAGNYMEEQLSPYWSKDLASGEWTPITWQTPDYNLALGVIRHGNVFALTQAEHAALRGADLSSVSVKTPPAKTTYTVGESLDLSSLVVTADYTDGMKDEVLAEGYGGYSVSGYDPATSGRQTVTVSYTVAGGTMTASFQVDVEGPSLEVSADTRCVGEKVMVTVRVTNNEAVHVKVSAESAYGTTPFGSVPPGNRKSRSFPTSAESVPAGKVTVKASTTLDGKPVTASLDAQYAARSCA